MRLSSFFVTERVIFQGWRKSWKANEYDSVIIAQECILKSLDQVFLLVNEGTIRKYQIDLADEIEPSINELIERAEQGLKALEKKESMLQAKV